MAAGKYKLRDGERVRLTRAVIATGTAIEAGDLVTVTTGLITKAAAASTAVAWCPDGHAANTGTSVEVTVGNDFTLVAEGESAFQATYRGGEYDINDTTQTIDYDASSTDVLKVDISEDAGVVGTAAGVTVRINKPLF
jgi:hypothetical protein